MKNSDDWQRGREAGRKEERERWTFWLSRVVLFGNPNDPPPPGFHRARSTKSTRGDRVRTSDVLPTPAPKAIEGAREQP